MSTVPRNLAAVLLAACGFALLVVPFLYIAIGALAGFSLLFSLVMLPVLLFGAAVLLWRLLPKKINPAASPVFWLIEGIAWLCVAAFTLVISKFSLFTLLERLGLFALFFCSAVILSALLIFLRKNTALERRCAALPKAVALILSLLIICPAVVLASLFLFSSPSFI